MQVSNQEKRGLIVWQSGQNIGQGEIRLESPKRPRGGEVKPGEASGVPSIFILFIYVGNPWLISPVELEIISQALPSE